MLRFWGKDIEKNLDKCLNVIDEAVFDVLISSNASWDEDGGE